MKTLVTGCAGFIGAGATRRLLQQGDEVIGIDNLNDYYDVKLKADRLKPLKANSAFRFEQIDITDGNAIFVLFEKERFDRVLHLAAQAGVRYSLANPLAYAQSNLLGFTNILEASRLAKLSHLVYASTSSVYGGNQKLPFSESDPVDHPVSFYAATKKANELMAHSYSHVFGLPTTGLRFFTVYGPWGRPDMSPMLFAKAVLNGEPIKVFNHGNMARDFTFIDDIVESVIRILDAPATASDAYRPLNPDPATSSAPYRIYNVGNQEPVGLLEYIDTLEEVLGRTTKRIMLPMQDGDIASTHADTALLRHRVGWAPVTPLREGLIQFAAWFKAYYNYA